MFLVLRGCDSYELVRSIVYNVCKVCDCTGSSRHGAKVYVFIIYDWIKLILLVFRIQIPNCQKYIFVIYSHVTQNDLQSVLIDVQCISNWVLYLLYIVLTCLKDVCKIMKFFFHEIFYFKSHLSLFCWELLIYSITKFLLKLQTFIHVYAMLTLAYWGKSCSLLVQSSLSI